MNGHCSFHNADALLLRGPAPVVPLLHVVPAPALGPWAAPLLTLPAAALAPWPGEVIEGVTVALQLSVPARKDHAPSYTTQVELYIEGRHSKVGVLRDVMAKLAKN